MYLKPKTVYATRVLKENIPPTIPTATGFIGSDCLVQIQ